MTDDPDQRPGRDRWPWIADTGNAAMTKRKLAPKTDAPPAVAPQRNLIVEASTTEEARRAVAYVLTAPDAAAARAIAATEGAHGIGASLDIMALADRLKEHAEAVNEGKTANVEAMLLNQATALQSLFVRLIERGMGADMLPQYEAHMRLALRAQSQCRATLETLAAIKNPPIVYARQANIAAGPQQVNNATSTRAHAQAREPETEQTKVLEAQSAEWLDTRAQAPTIGANPSLATVGAIDRTQDRGR